MKHFAALLVLAAVPALAQEPAATTDRPVDILPIRHLDLSGLSAPGFPVKQGRQFWFQLSAAGGVQGLCDPFGRFDTECSGAVAPVASVSAGGSYWSIRTTGGLYPGLVSGMFGEATVRGQFTRIGPVGLGLTLEAAGRTWQRDVFTSGTSTIGTSRRVIAGFGGLDVSVGRLDRRHVSIAVLPGFWQSSYKGTTDTGAPPQELAHHEYALVRVRLEAHNFAVGRRVRVSGILERTGFYLTERHPVPAPFAPAVQWAFMPSLSYKIWTPSRHTSFNVALQMTVTGGGPSQLREQGLDLGIAWRFR